MFEKLKRKSKKIQKRNRTGETILACPECGSNELYYEAGLITGYKYHCKKCDYIGSFVIEKKIENEKNPQSNQKEDSEKDVKKEPKYRIA